MPDIFRDPLINLPDGTLNVGGTVTTVAGVTTITGGVNININRFALEFHLVDSSTQQTTLLTQRGGARLVWPDTLLSLTAAQRRRVLERAIEEIVAIKLESVS